MLEKEPKLDKHSKELLKRWPKDGSERTRSLINAFDDSLNVFKEKTGPSDVIIKLLKSKARKIIDHDSFKELSSPVFDRFTATTFSRNLIMRGLLRAMLEWQKRLVLTNDDWANIFETPIQNSVQKYKNLIMDHFHELGPLLKETYDGINNDEYGFEWKQNKTIDPAKRGRTRLKFEGLKKRQQIFDKAIECIVNTNTFDPTVIEWLKRNSESVFWHPKHARSYNTQISHEAFVWGWINAMLESQNVFKFSRSKLTNTLGDLGEFDDLGELRKGKKLIMTRLDQEYFKRANDSLKKARERK